MSTRLFAIVLSGFTAACIMLGGASAAGIVANAVLQIGAILIAAIATRRLWRDGVDPRARQPLLLLGAVFAVGLIQLVPLPPSTWTLLPARDVYAADLSSLGITLPWLGISLAPEATLAAMLWLLPAGAVFLGVLSLDLGNRRWIVWAIVATAAVSALIGLMQILGRVHMLYFYAITNGDSAVGVFANKNHQATLLLVAIPLLEALRTMAGASADLRPARPGVRVATYSAILFFVIGITSTSSRAGLALLFPTLLLTFALHRRLKAGIISAPMLGGAIALAALAVVAVFLSPTGERLYAKTTALSEDTRVQAAGPTFRAALAHLPFGSGLGTFDPIYRKTASTDALGANYVNHAHDDYLELLLTTGLTGVAVLIWFFCWYGAALGEAWRQRPSLPGPIPRAATIVIGIVAVHSILDYPLRTAGISAVFAASCAMLIPASARIGRQRLHVSGNRNVQIM